MQTSLQPASGDESLLRILTKGSLVAILVDIWKISALHHAALGNVCGPDEPLKINTILLSKKYSSSSSMQSGTHYWNEPSRTGPVPFSPGPPPVITVTWHPAVLYPFVQSYAMVIRLVSVGQSIKNIPLKLVKDCIDRSPEPGLSQPSTNRRRHCPYNRKERYHPYTIVAKKQVAPNHPCGPYLRIWVKKNSDKSARSDQDRREPYSEPAN